MNDMSPSPFDVSPTPQLTPSNAVVFSGSRRAFVGLVARGTLLELVTVGFYRFWLATDIRRHLWANTSVDGDAAEYTGTAKELLIGFLFALAILAPVYLAYFLIGIETERQQAFASVPLVLFFYLFAQFAIYRARRYRLTRTIWRGVRFWMTGSGVSYAWRASLWGLFSVVTLGLALPWMRAALERYKMRHTAYGDLLGSFAATGGNLFGQGWWLWLLAWLPVLLPVSFGYLAPHSGAAFFLSMLSWIMLPFIYAAFKAIEWRWWISGLRIGAVSFESSLAASDLIGLYWKWIGWIVLFTTGLGIWFAVAIGLAYGQTDPSLGTMARLVLISDQIPILIALGIGYIAGALAGGAVTRIYLMRDVWQRVAASVTVSNLAAADNVVARGDTVSALGEGFANSLDVAGF